MLGKISGKRQWKHMQYVYRGGGGGNESPCKSIEWSPACLYPVNRRVVLSCIWIATELVFMFPGITQLTV